MNDTNKNSSSLFAPSGCLTGDALLLFVSGSLNSGDLALAQQHMLSCPLCTDAVEGLGMWLKENKPDAHQDGITERSAKAPEFPANHYFAGSKDRKRHGILLDDFEVRTETINERIRQRVIFHKQMMKIRPTRRLNKAYEWIAVAATLVIFVGIFYVLQVQNFFDKPKLADKNVKSEVSQPLSSAEAAPKADTSTKNKSDLAVNNYKKHKQVLDYFPPQDEALSNDMEILYENPVQEVIPVNPALAHGAVIDDTFDSNIVASPDEISGIIVTANRTTQDNKVMGATVQEEAIEKSAVRKGQKLAKTAAQGSAQNKSEEKEFAKEVFTIVEEMPSFPGGEDARIKFLAQNTSYPTQAAENGIEGTVYVSFIVQPNGKITDCKIVRGIGGGCDEETLRVVNKMPSWKPGKQNGKKVAVLFTMPVSFRLH